MTLTIAFDELFDTFGEKADSQVNLPHAVGASVRRSIAGTGPVDVALNIRAFVRNVLNNLIKGCI